MKSLAAVNIRQFERAVESLDAYHGVVDAGWLSLLHLDRGVASQPPATDIVCMVIASDQGMCGQFNETVLGHALAQVPLWAARGAEVIFWFYGEKLRGALEGGQHPVAHFAVPGNLPAVNTQVQEVVQHVEGQRTAHGIEHFYVCHNVIAQGGAYRQICSRLLPLDKVWRENYTRRRWPGRCLPMVSLPREEMFRHLFRQHLFVSVYRAFAQSLAAENAARLAAMQAAEKNILETIDDLQAEFRQLRQTAITGELLDIISGFEALSDEFRAV